MLTFYTMTEIEQAFYHKLQKQEFRQTRLGLSIELQNVHFIANKPDIMPEVFSNADDEAWYELHYMPFIRPQIQPCLDLLKQDPNTRQAVLVFLDRQSLLKPDFPCTAFSQFFINGDHLSYIVSMRSQSIDHFRNDLIYHTSLLRHFNTELTNYYGINFTSDQIQYNCNSLHIYEPDFPKLKQF